MLLRQILRRQAFHRRDECGRIARERQREAIGAALIRARHRVRDRDHDERHSAGREHEQRQAGDVSHAAQREHRREAGQRARCEVEAREDQRALEDNPLPDIAVHVMRELVREDDFDFLVGVLGQHRVGDEDAPRGAEPRERRVRLAGFLAQSPFIRAKHLCARAIGETQQTRMQRFAFERLDAIEQRQQQHRREIGEADDEQREDRARRHPPAAWRQPDQRVDDRRARRRQHEADRE